MIRANLVLTGFFIDKPDHRSILIDETAAAVERKNEKTNKLERLTVGELYDIFVKSGSYIRDASDPSDHLTQEHFYTWFRAKYIIGTPLEFKVTKITFERI
jgi:hypothetical protein